MYHLILSLACAFLLSSCNQSEPAAPGSAKDNGVTGGANIGGSPSEKKELDPDEADTMADFAESAGPSTKKKLLELNEQIEKNPEDPKVYLVRSEFLLRADKPNLALIDAEKAVIISPDSVPAHRQRAQCLEILQREDDAQKDHELILKQNPLDKKALLHRGLFSMSRNKNKDAVADFSKLIDGGTTNKAAFQWRAKAHENLGEFDKAIEDYELYLKHKPNEEKVIQRHLELCLKRGKWEKALRDTDKLLLHYPRDSGLHKTKGDILSGLKQYEKAIVEYTVACEAEPSFAKAFEKRAQAYDKINRPELATEDRAKVEELKQVRPDHEALSAE